MAGQELLYNLNAKLIGSWPLAEKFLLQGIERSLRSPLFFRSLCNSGLQGPLSFSFSILQMIPWNSPNGEMYEGHIWVSSTIQISRKQNASNRRFQATSESKLLRQVIQCKQKKRRWPTWGLSLVNLTNRIARFSLILKSTKVFKIRKGYLRIIFFLMQFHKYTRRS